MKAPGKTSFPLTLCMVNFNGERYLEETLGSVLNQEDGFKEILLIDNASQDRSLEIVASRFPSVRLIKLNENRGPAVARNAGYKMATCDRILFMDNDVSLSPNCPDILTRALNDNARAAVAMPRVLYAHNNNLIQYDGADCHFLGLMTLHNVNQPLSSSTSETTKMSSIVTACFLIDRERWGKDDPFDETFLFNYEDHDFGVRTRTLGHEILSVPSALCYHREGTVGLSFRGKGNYSKVRAYCLIRNRWQVILKNYELKTLIILSPILFFYELFQLMGIIGKGWFVEWLRALLWVAFHPIHIFRKRQLVQKERKTPDREILQNGPIPFREDVIKSPLERLVKNYMDRIAKVYWDQFARFI